MEQYNTSKNVLEALACGAKYGASQSLAKQDGTYRNQNNRSYWTNFSSDAYKNYADGWNDFQKSLSKDDGVRLHLSFGSDRLYRTPELWLRMNSLV